MSNKTKTTPFKETVRRFTVTSNIVLDISAYKEATDENIKGAIESLLESAFSKADPKVVIEANMVSVEPAVL